MISAPAGSRKTCELTPDSIQQDVMRSRELPPHRKLRRRLDGPCVSTTDQYQRRQDNSSREQALLDRCDVLRRRVAAAPITIRRGWSGTGRPCKPSAAELASPN
jgi:hypothetical protein